MRRSALFFVLVSIACSEPPAPAKADATESASPPTAETAKKARPAAKKEDAPSPGRKAKPARTFADELAALDRSIAANLARAEKAPQSYMVLEQAANKYLARARLSGDWNDYAKAEELIDRGFTLREGTGPFLTRAHLNATLHRLDRVDSDVKVVRELQIRTLSAAALTGLTTFEGEVAFQRGEYAEALERYDGVLAKHPDHYGALTAKATYLWKTGAFEDAEAHYDRAEKQYHGKSAEPRAWFDLMRGLIDLDRGRYDEALAHYRLAEQDLQGWWLVDEHVAEILTLTGKTEEAKALYLDVIERTGNPEFLDAMAGILRAEGKTAEADAMIAKARAKYEAQLEQYPEAAYGHALGHFLEFGDDAQKTLELAQKNYALRPNGEAATLLAQAYLKAGEPKDAKKLIDKTLKTPWRSADLHATAVEVYEAVGDTKAAEAQRAKALAINPKAFD